MHLVMFGGATQIRTGGKGFADPGLTTWRWRLTIDGKNPLIKKMERETRFELATFALARRRSTTEPFPHIICNGEILVGTIGLEPMTLCL